MRGGEGGFKMMKGLVRTLGSPSWQPPLGQGSAPPLRPDQAGRRRGARPRPGPSQQSDPGSPGALQAPRASGLPRRRPSQAANFPAQPVARSSFHHGTAHSSRPGDLGRAPLPPATPWASRGFSRPALARPRHPRSREHAIPPCLQPGSVTVSLPAEPACCADGEAHEAAPLLTVPPAR